MSNIVGIRFERAGKISYFSCGDLQLTFGDHVIVESSWGLDFGTVVTPTLPEPQPQAEAAAEKEKTPLRSVVRLATPEDERSFENMKKQEPEAFAYCQQQIAKFGLPMKLIRVSYTFDGGKIIFYFSSENRVDFRELVKVLAAHYHTRIELRQVGVRDEARIVGGYSTCGRELCCASFLNNFHPVSIKMAKKQNLALNPAKISGVCGRLMCCLYYEYDSDKNEPDFDENIEGAPEAASAKKCRKCPKNAANQNRQDKEAEDLGTEE